MTLLLMTVFLFTLCSLSGKKEKIFKLIYLWYLIRCTGVSAYGVLSPAKVNFPSCFLWTYVTSLTWMSTLGLPASLSLIHLFTHSSCVCSVSTGSQGIACVLETEWSHLLHTIYFMFGVWWHTWCSFIGGVFVCLSRCKYVHTYANAYTCKCMISQGNQSIPMKTCDYLLFS